jgi:uroporphyrinogen decarboxylase
MERVLEVLSGNIPDRVPLLLLFSMYGAKECDMDIKEYFHSVDTVVETQLMMQKKYHTDCLYTFSYASVETEAFGGDTIFYSEGPPNAGAPIIRSSKDIDGLTPPDVKSSEPLKRILNITQKLKTVVGDTIPIIGVVMSPFSLPVMQMGYEPYLKLMHNDRLRFDRLMQCNKKFCTDWANAQLEAGATAICYFNPLASTDMTEKGLYLETGYPIDCEVIKNIQGPTATHLASGRAQSNIKELQQSGTYIVGISAKDSIAKIKEESTLNILGNLCGISMSNWNKAETEQNVKALLAEGMPGGRFLLGDNHGEIPWQVKEETLLTISESVAAWGTYSREENS